VSTRNRGFLREIPQELSTGAQRPQTVFSAPVSAPGRFGHTPRAPPTARERQRPLLVVEPVIG